MPAPRHGRGVWILLGAGAVVIAAAGVLVAVLATRGSTAVATPAPGSAERPVPVAQPTAPPSVPQTPVEMPSRAPVTEADEAVRLLTAGQAEAAMGQHTKARDLLERAYALDPQPGTLLQLAELEHRAGRCREARLAAQRVIAGGTMIADAQQLLETIGRCD